MKAIAHTYFHSEFNGKYIRISGYRPERGPASC